MKYPIVKIVMRKIAEERKKKIYSKKMKMYISLLNEMGNKNVRLSAN